MRPKVQGVIKRLPSEMRYFFAIQPPEDVRARLDTLARYYADERTRLLPPENLHVTLAYLGELDGRSLDDVMHIPETLPYQPFNIIFKQLEFWKKPQIYCLTATAPMMMLQLAYDLQSRCRELGIPVATRPYRPHITLLRKATKPLSLPMPDVGWHAESVCLYLSESKSTPGPRYTVLQRWPLRIV